MGNEQSIRSSLTTSILMVINDLGAGLSISIIAFSFCAFNKTPA